MPDSPQAKSVEPPGESRRILNLGSGARPVEGAVNLDITDRTKPDVVHDLNEHPWPFPADRFDEILGYDVLEHVRDVVAFMQEVHRVARRGAVVRLTVPHFSSGNAWRDPTHVRAFSYASLDYFTEGHPNAFYSEARFQRVQAWIQFPQSPLNRVVQRAANRWPDAYERRWAWMFPGWFIYFELRVLKEAPAMADQARRR